MIYFIPLYILVMFPIILKDLPSIFLNIPWVSMCYNLPASLSILQGIGNHFAVFIYILMDFNLYTS